ncbi:unnamed protein product, partial [Adineta steineri]
LSFDQPKFCSTATWNPNGIIFANETTIGSSPRAMFIDSNNTVYALNQDKHQILIWSAGSINPTKTISANFSDSFSMFVTDNGDIYFDNSEDNGRVDRWISSTNTFDIVMNSKSTCSGLFIDTNNTLYCSMFYDHQVVKRWLNDNSMTLTTVAGMGKRGSALNQLDYPMGIFVDVNADLYVADNANDRVQLFKSGQSIAITVAGDGSIQETILLLRPTGVVLDRNGHLFILDRGNHRIIKSGQYGFQCLVGCDGEGSQSNQLSNPITMNFDRSGNIFVTDTDNHRIQKYTFYENSCLRSYNLPKLCSSATWNPDGITFADETIIGSDSISIFVDTNNTVYTMNRENKQILIWSEGSVNPTNIISANFSNSSSIFVTYNGDIYFDNGDQNGRVTRWISNTNTFVTVLNVDVSCYGLFVDTNDTLYCSMFGRHQVVKRWLNEGTMTSIIVAGTGIEGSALNELNNPMGIFVDLNSGLYVADNKNNRIQLFKSGQSIAITVAGDGSVQESISLLRPTGVVLDRDGYLFIVDSGNNRIVGSGLDGFRCLVGCDA